MSYARFHLVSVLCIFVAVVYYELHSHYVGNGTHSVCYLEVEPRAHIMQEIVYVLEVVWIFVELPHHVRSIVIVLYSSLVRVRLVKFYVYAWCVVLVFLYAIGY